MYKKSSKRTHRRPYLLVHVRDLQDFKRAGLPWGTGAQYWCFPVPISDHAVCSAATTLRMAECWLGSHEIVCGCSVLRFPEYPGRGWLQLAHSGSRNRMLNFRTAVALGRCGEEWELAVHSVVWWRKWEVLISGSRLNSEECYLLLDSWGQFDFLL